MRGLFAVLAAAILYLQLLPLETAPRGWVGPDLLLVLSCAWAARRPDLVPVWLLAAVFLLADFMLQRPPGLWAAGAVLATEALRARASDLRDMSFALEWSIVGGILAAFYLAFAILWSILVPYEIGSSLLIMQLLLSLLVYPVIVGLSAALFGVTKAAPGQTDAMGRKL